MDRLVRGRNVQADAKNASAAITITDRAAPGATTLRESSD